MQFLLTSPRPTMKAVQGMKSRSARVLEGRVS